MSKILEQRRRVARRVAAVLARDGQTSAALVFGSVAHGEVDVQSDVDMLVVCRAAVPSPAQRRWLLEQLGTGWTIDQAIDQHGMFAVADEGTVDGIEVMLHYQTDAWIDAVLEDVVANGAITTARLSFRPYTLPALLQRGLLLYDAEGAVERWRERSRVYPAALQRNILQHFVPRLREHTADLVATAERGLGVRIFLFLLNWAVDDLASMLFALNKVYDPADKRMDTQVVPRLAYLPPDYVATLQTVLEGPFDAPGMRLRARLFERLAAEVLREAELAHASE